MTSSSESEDLLLPVDFWGQNVSLCLERPPKCDAGLSADETNSCKQAQFGKDESPVKLKLECRNVDSSQIAICATGNGTKYARKSLNKKTDSSSEYDVKRGKDLAKLPVANRKKRQKNSVTSPSTGGEISAVPHQLVEDEPHTSDEQSPQKHAMLARLRRRRKRKATRPVIYSDSDSDEIDNSVSKTTSTISATKTSRLDDQSEVGGTPSTGDAVRLVKPCPDSGDSPCRNGSKLSDTKTVFEASDRKRLRNGRGIFTTGPNSKQSSRNFPQTSGKLDKTSTSVNITKKRGSGDAGEAGDTEIGESSFKPLPQKLTSKDYSADEIDAAQVERSFNECDKFKISRSRFGAFRRKKDYKFAPLIFVDENKNKKNFDSKEKSSLLSYDQNPEERTSLENYPKETGKCKDDSPCTSSPGHDERERIKTPQNKCLGDSKFDTLHGASSKNSSFKHLETEKSPNSSSNGKESGSRGGGDSESPQKRKVYAMMNEIFLGGNGQKIIKPAPAARRILQSEEKETSAKECKVTLLDDDSLWSSTSRSRLH